MGTRRINFAEALQALNEQTAVAVEEHPMAEELVAYQEGRLPEERLQSTKAHLAVCPDCTRAVLDFALFPDVELRVPGHTRTVHDEEEDWRLIEGRLAAASRNEALAGELQERRSGPKDVQRLTPIRVLGPRTGIVWLRAAAVFFLVSTLGLAALVVDLQRRAGQSVDTDGFETNIYFEEIAPVGETGRRSAQAIRVAVPSGMNSILLFLISERFGDFESYEAELVSEAEGERFRFHGLVQGTGGAFSIQLARRQLPAGSYYIELFGITPSARTSLDTYRFIIDYL